MHLTFSSGCCSSLLVLCSRTDSKTGVTRPHAALARLGQPGADGTDGCRLCEPAGVGGLSCAGGARTTTRRPQQQQPRKHRNTGIGRLGSARSHQPVCGRRQQKHCDWHASRPAWPLAALTPRKKKFRMCGSTGPTLNSRLTWCEQKIGHRTSRLELLLGDGGRNVTAVGFFSLFVNGLSERYMAKWVTQTL